MSETSNTSLTAATKPWPKEQNWIKDVLSKSGTELVQLSPNKAVKIIKKVVKQNEKNSQHSTTMVYYPSTPLIIKSEEPNDEQMCTPLRSLHELQHTTQQLQSTTTSTTPPNNSYILNNVNITTIQHHQQQMSHNINTKSITKNHHQTQQQPQYFKNIKTELLPPGITLYASTQPASLTIKPAVTTQSPTPAPPTNNVSSSTILTTTTSVRKPITTKPQFKCEQCGMTFGSKSAHTSHTKSHAKNGDVNLINSVNSSNTSAGDNSLPIVTGLEINKSGVPLGIPKMPQIQANAATTGGDPYQCNVCQKTFAVPARLIRHYRTHTGERPFECEFCHKLFSVKENLQVHRRIHTKERPYKCDVCGRAFEHSGKLHRHMRIHTGERPHKCSVCDKTFIQSGQLVIHMRTHTGEKPYKCPVEGCGKGFTCSKQLKVHSRTHTGEKPYHCDICFRDFGYNHVLKLHRVQHYGSKCYKCTICDETFKSKKEMEAHIKGHANEMPDDDEEVNATGNGTQNSVSASSGAETNSGPNSPQSPSSSIGNATTTTASTKNGNSTKPRRQRIVKQTITQAVRPTSPRSPGSPISSSMSPSSSYASGSRLSAASPTSSVASPTMSLSLETDHHSRDSGVASASLPCNNNRQLAAASLVDLSHQGGFPASDEMPTDLSITQNHHLNEEHKFQIKKHQQQAPLKLSYPQYQSSPSPQHQPNHLLQQQQQYHYLNTSTSPSHATEVHHTSINSSPQHHVRYEQQQQPTINPALLEAATIASRREDDVEQAAIQIMQLRHSQHKSNSNEIYTDLQRQHNLTNNIHHNKCLITPQQYINPPIDMVKSMGMTNLNENLIDRYTNDDLARRSRGGLSKGYAPVPKFEPSLHDNEIILRQVEAAIAPLRSSTNSPDRSSSPECDIILVSDRDVMTLPLRKRKLYMSDCNDAAGDNENSDKSANKVVRHNSVIQFAKAS